MGNGRDIPINLLGKETVSPAAGKAGRALDKMGDQAEGAAKDAAKLDREVEDLNRSLVALAAAYAAAGSEAERADIFKAIKVDQAKLRKQMNVRKLMGDVGADGAEGFSIGFAQRIGPLIAKAPISPPIVAALAAGAPLMSSVVSGAVTAGVALASVGAGLAIAFTDSRVQAAGEILKKQIGDDLKDAAKPFVPAVLDATDRIRTAWRQDLKPELEGLFADSARYVRPLTEAGIGFSRELAPGLRDANREAQPLIDTLGEHGPKAGEAFSDALRRLADDSQNTAAAVDGAFTLMEGSLTSLTLAMQGLNKAGPLIGLGPLMALGDADDPQIIGKWVEPTEELGNVFAEAGDKAAAGGEKVRSFFEIVREGTDRNLDARQAVRDFEQAIDDATATIEENGKTLDRNTEKGRANEAALDGIRREAYEAAGAVVEMGGSQAQANVILERGRQAFINAAIAAGMERRAAETLAAQLFKLPDVNKTINYNDKPARDAITRVVNAGGRVKDIVRGIYYTTHGDLKLPGGTQMKEHGGPVKAGHAYIVGEKRPEVFVPNVPGKIIPSIEEYTKFGPAMGKSPAAAPVVNNHYTINVHSGVIGSPRELQAWFTRMFDEANRRQARTANLYMRSG